MHNNTNLQNINEWIVRCLSQEPLVWHLLEIDVLSLYNIKGLIEDQKRKNVKGNVEIWKFEKEKKKKQR
jgi:hypothetical protein